MAITVKKVVLWRRELDNRAGALAAVLQPLALAGADLQIAMGYRFPGNETRAAVELAPVEGKKAAAAAQTAGLQPSGIPTFIVTGDNRPGLVAREAIAHGDLQVGAGAHERLQHGGQRAGAVVQLAAPQHGLLDGDGHRVLLQ